MSLPLSPTSQEGHTQRSKYLAFLVAAIFIALGVAAAVAPDLVIAASQSMVSLAGIYVAAAVRCGLGVALLLIAPSSRAPAILRIIGAALLVAGLTMPLLGLGDARARVEWEAQHIPFFRLEGVLFVVAGVVLYKLSQPPPNTSLERTREG